MESREVFEQVYGVIGRHKILIAAAVLVGIGNGLSNYLQNIHFVLAIGLLVLLMPLQLGILKMALNAWRDEPVSLGQIVMYYLKGRLGRSLIYALAWMAAAFIAGVAIGAGVLISAFCGMLAIPLMFAVVFFGLAIYMILIYPMLMAYLEQDTLTVSEAYGWGRELTQGQFKPLLGMGWGIFWRCVLVVFLPVVLMMNLGQESIGRLIIEIFMISVVGLYTNAMIAGIWLQLLKKEAHNNDRVSQAEKISEPVSLVKESQ